LLTPAIVLGGSVLNDEDSHCGGLHVNWPLDSGVGNTSFKTANSKAQCATAPGDAQ
jgi:hypothetical protein